MTSLMLSTSLAILALAGTGIPQETPSALPTTRPATQAASRPAATQSSAERAVMQRLALARARTAAHARLMSVPIRRGLTLGHWIARDRGVDTRLREWVWSRPVSRARVFEDGTAEIDVLLSTGELIQRLRAARTSLEQGGAEDVSFEEISGRLSRVPYLCGRGVVDADDRPAREAPPGWEDVAEADRAAAGRAAVAGAAAALYERVAAERLTTASLVRDFVESSESLREATLEALGASQARVEFLPHQIARLELAITRIELLRLLTSLYREHYRGDEFRSEHFREFALLLRRERFRAEGEAVAPAPLIDEIAVDPEAPAWAERPLRVALRRDADEAAVRAKIEEAAGAIVLARGVTLGQFIAFHPELRGEYERVLGGACPSIDTSTEHDTVYEVSLTRMWQSIRDALSETGARK